MKIQVVRCGVNAKLPTRGSAKSAGGDLYSAKEMSIPARGKGKIPTDIKIKLPEGHMGRICPRSGLAIKNGIDVGAGIIDEDYRGLVDVVLFNHNDEDFNIKIGDRIAQLVIEPIHPPEFEEVVSLDETARGADGFGSTGV